MTPAQYAQMLEEAKHDPSIAQYLKNNVMVGDTPYYVSSDQTPLAEANPELLSMASVPGGITTLPDGRYAVRNDIASEWGRAQTGDFVQNFLNGPGAVLLPMGILGGATLAANGGFSNPFTSNPFGNATFGNAEGIGGNIMNVGAEVGGEMAGGFADPWDLMGNLDAYGLGSGGSSLGGLSPLDLEQMELPGSVNHPGVTDFSPTRTIDGMGVSGLAKFLSQLTGGDSQGGAGLFPNANLGSLLSGGLQGVLGYIGAKEQADALRDTQNQWLGLGAPSRARYEASFNPGFDIFSADPAAQQAAQSSADATARAMSASFGNVFDQPHAQGQIFRGVLNQVALPQLNTYRSQNLTGGQLGTNIAGTASLQEAGQAGGGLNAIGYGLGSALNGQQSLQDLLKQIGGGNYRMSGY